jgi:hypothetical protein
MHAANPRMPNRLNKVMPRGPKPNRNFPELIPKLNALYEAAFKDDALVTFCDSYTLFDDGHASVKKDEFPDLLHPNGVGYDKWKTGTATDLREAAIGCAVSALFIPSDACADPCACSCAETAGIPETPAIRAARCRRGRRSRRRGCGSVGSV